MKTLKSALTFLFLSLFIISCQKEDIPQNVIPTVDAGNDTAITLAPAVDSILLNGEAFDKDGTVDAYLWSEVSGPNSILITTPGSASTYAKGFVTGKYVFQLMATDNKGATGVKSVSISVVKQSNINLNSGLLAYYPFNNNYNDYSGNGNNGALSPAGGGLTSDHNGIPNAAFDVKGNGQELIVSNNGKIAFDSSLTISFNCMARGYGRYSYVGMLDYSTGFGQSFYSGTSDALASNFGFNVTNLSAPCNYWPQSSEVSGRPTSVIAGLNVWNNYICTFNKGNLKVYLNGSLVYSIRTVDKKLKMCSGSELLIGGWWSNDPAASPNGKIDEVRLYNRELNTEEILELSKDFRDN